ncbi:MAG TPA: aminopeptidase, partial [Flavobacteriales bacterium]|nr:aminopeptidase [Flavobacteriales bacterium]
VLAAWFQHTIRSNYEPAWETLDSFLTNVGRRKFLTPTYRAMKESGQILLAREIYSKARGNYHSVATNTIDELLGLEQ